MIDRLGATASSLALLAGLVTGLAEVARTGRFVLLKTSNERAAVASLRKIVKAQQMFSAECGGGYYSTSLMDLSTRPPGKSEGYLSPKKGELGWTITSPVRGYLFTIRPGKAAVPGRDDCNEFPTQTAYYALAVPGSQGVTGDRTFATNQDGIIWERSWLPPPAEPFGPPDRRQ